MIPRMTSLGGVVRFPETGGAGRRMGWRLQRDIVRRERVTRLRVGWWRR